MFTNVEYRKSNGSFDENVELHNVLIFGKQVDYVRRNVEKGNFGFDSSYFHI
jgi:single-stranded DNA-binding protein